jgi:pimeloyl-ACP methyl ester carboxylesterase
MQREQAVRKAASIVRESLDLDIEAPWAGGETLSMALDVYHPLDADKGALLFCAPGGGVNRRYFDMKTDAPGATSFATEMALRGHTVVAVDPPGVGDSTRPENGFVLTADVVADCFHATLQHFLEVQPQLKGRPIIGVGHSAGSMLVTLQQARHRDFAALMLTCFGPVGRPDQFSEAELAALAPPDLGRSQLVELTRQHFHGQAYIDIAFRPAAANGGEPLRGVLDKVLALVAIQAMTPGNVALELAQIDVPVMLALGGRDMTGPPHQMPAHFASCCDLYLHVVPESGHHIFLAAAAPQFYERAGFWLSDFSKG